MDVFKTRVGKHLNNMFLENVALNVARFLEMSTVERIQKELKNLLVFKFYQTLEAYELKGKRPPFPKYQTNLRMGTDGVYSYGTQVIKLNWMRRTMQLLGRWSRTTSRHQNYALKTLKADWDFREIKG